MLTGTNDFFYDLCSTVDPLQAPIISVEDSPSMFPCKFPFIHQTQATMS